jgi:uncharacterized membrane protein
MIIIIFIIIISIIIIHILTILSNNCQMIFLLFRIVKNITLLPLFQKKNILSLFQTISWFAKRTLPVSCSVKRGIVTEKRQSGIENWTLFHGIPLMLGDNRDWNCWNKKLLNKIIIRNDLSSENVQSRKHESI